MTCFRVITAIVTTSTTSNGHYTTELSDFPCAKNLVLSVTKALSQDMSTLRSTAMSLKLDVSSEIKT